MRLLLARHAPVDAVTVVREAPSGRDVLLRACRCCAFSNLLCVLVWVAEVAQDRGTPLHHAAYTGAAEAARLMLEAGASVTAVNRVRALCEWVVLYVGAACE